MKYRKKPLVIEAISFDELVEHGKREYLISGRQLTNHMPWSFTYQGLPITHENDQCYLIPNVAGTLKMTPGDMLVTGTHGELYSVPRVIFDEIYDTNPLNEAHARRTEFIDLVTKELDRAYQKHGKGLWGRHEFYGILKEEVDEAWEDIKNDQPTDKLLKEIVQIAAMCLRYYETEDRYRGMHDYTR